MRFLSVSHSANALLNRRCSFNPAERFCALGTVSTGKRRPLDGSYALACVLFGTRAFLVLYLSSLHPLMSDGPDSWPDLTCNGSTGGVPDTYHMFSGRLLTKNASKLTNNGCKTVVRGTKLMTYIFWGIIKGGFPVSLSAVQKRSWLVGSGDGAG